MSLLTEVITARDTETRNRPLDAFCRAATLEELLLECEALDRFRRGSDNLYERVRALFFLYAIHRFHVSTRKLAASRALIPFAGYSNLLKRRFEEALDIFLAAQAVAGPSAALSSALAAGYRSLGFQTLADQVRRSVRSVRGNQWMFRAAYPEDAPLRIRPELLKRETADDLFPILREATPVRMDLSHSGWSDIFFLGMDFPEGARVLNISIDLSVRSVGAPKPPVEAWFRVIDQPVLRLVSVDLQCSAELGSIAEVFDFAHDYLGLLKAAVIASGIMPPGMEGATQPLTDLLTHLTGRPGHGIEIVSKVNDIPRGSRLAVSTNLLACLISLCMRATNQIRTLTGGLSEDDRRLVAGRAILGEWLGGSGGGWQDSGGVWPGIKLIHGVSAQEGDPEFGISRGRLLPNHQILGPQEVSPETRKQLQQSLVLAHGGMAQDVGPILEMVTEKYLLRSESEWQGRSEAALILDDLMAHLKTGDIRALGALTERNFTGPIQTIIPWAGNLYTDTLIRRVRREMGDDFWGFWMLGGMSGGGMGFLFAPHAKALAQERLQAIMSATKRELEHALPFAMEPVVYDFAVNEDGTQATHLAGDSALMPPGYYQMVVPSLLRQESRLLSPLRLLELARFTAACHTVPEFQGMMQHVFEHLIPQSPQKADLSQSLDALLETHGFDRVEHEQIQASLRNGRVGLAQNRLPITSMITDVGAADLFDATDGVAAKYHEIGKEALAAGMVAVVSFAGGTGSRWTKGAGVVKALNPFCRLGGTCLSGCFSKPQYVVVSLGWVAWNGPSSSHLLVGRGLVLGSESQQGLESRHRLLAPIMAKDEFIKISLELMAAHAVMGSEQPLLQVADGAVGQRHRGLRAFVQVRSRRLRAGHMAESSFVQSTKAPEAVGVNARTRCYVLSQERDEGFASEIRDDRHASASGRATALLHRDHDEGGLPAPQLSASPQTPLDTSNPGVVQFHFPAQRLAGQVDHGLPQLVQDHPRCLVTSQTQLALQEKRRDAAFIRGHEVGRPEPNGQRRFRVMQNRSCRKGHLIPTTCALPALRFHDWVRIPVPAPRADEAVRPAALSQILLASFFGREHRLELA